MGESMLDRAPGVRVPFRSSFCRNLNGIRDVAGASPTEESVNEARAGLDGSPLQRYLRGK